MQIKWLPLQCYYSDKMKEVGFHIQSIISGRMIGQMAVLLAFLISIGSCGRNQLKKSDETGDTVRMKYAENITIVKYSDQTVVELKDPWNKGKVLHRYVFPKDKLPLTHNVVFNTAHASLIGMLHADDKIVGVADLKYMNLPAIHRRIGKGITDCGDSMSPDIEKIIDVKADAVWLSPFENSGGYGKLEKLGIPIIECADYMETSALGRAEWMKFYGLLIGNEHAADSLFNIVDSAYHALMSQARESKVRYSIITEKLTGSTWYVAGGKSSVGRLIKDADGLYAWSDDEHSGSLAMSFESVLDKAGGADVWVFNDGGQQPYSYKQLRAEYHGYLSLKPFRTKRVYCVNSSIVPYFEEVSFRPDLLLADYIMLLHPDLPRRPLRYYRALTD